MRSQVTWRTRRPWTERTQVPQEIERSEKSQSVSQSDVREVEPVDFSETLPRSYSYSTASVRRTVLYSVPDTGSGYVQMSPLALRGRGRWPCSCGRGEPRDAARARTGPLSLRPALNARAATTAGSARRTTTRSRTSVTLRRPTSSSSVDLPLSLPNRPPTAHSLIT